MSDNHAPKKKCRCVPVGTTTTRGCAVPGCPNTMSYAVGDNHLADRFGACPILSHRKKAVSICGECKYFCNGCIGKGWYSLAGTGGSSDIVNIKTGQRIRD